MLIRRSLGSLTGLLALTLSLCAQNVSAPESAAGDVNSSEQLYRAYSEFYFLRRDIEFTLEMTLRESFLAWLYQGIAQEASSRAADAPSATLDAISPPELAGYNESEYAVGEIPADAPLRIRYAAYMNYLHSEFNHKYLQARLIKDRLIENATHEQCKRMFKRDTESAMLAYRDELYRDAILRFDECINAYGYVDVADIVFYRAETYLALHLYELAFADYLYVIEKSSDAKLRVVALERLIPLVGDRGDISVMLEFWTQYQTEFGPQSAKYWTMAELAARYLFASSRWSEARAIFMSIPTNSPNYMEAQLRAGDCSLALIDLDDARARFTSLVDMPVGKNGGIKAFAVIKREAQIRLGYINYMRGEYDLAFANFSRIKGDDDLAEHSELMSIWSLYKLNSYTNVQQLCNEFITAHPNSQYLYEAKCLLGFAQEMMGGADNALKDYRSVMGALDDRQDFHDFNYELKAIAEALGELNRMEEMIFMAGESDLFPDYLALRQKLSSLTNGVKLARAIKTTPMLTEILKEQVALGELFAEQQAFEQQLYEAQDTKLFNEYRNIVDGLMDSGSELSAAVRFYMKQKSLIQREQDQQFEALMVDTLRNRLEREWAMTREALNLLRAERTRIGITDPSALVDLSGLEVDLTALQDRILKVRNDLKKLGQDRVKSNLDEWSDFAYQRYTFGGLNFDNFYAQQHRLDALDRYIQQTGQILRERIEARKTVRELPVELILVTQPNEAPYYAPMAPLWGVQPAERVSPPTESMPAPLPEGSLEPPAEPTAPIQDEPVPTEIPGETTPADPQVKPADEPAPEPGGAEPPTEPSLDPGAVEPTPAPEPGGADPSTEPPGEPAPQPQTPPGAGEQHSQDNYNREVPADQ